MYIQLILLPQKHRLVIKYWEKLHIDSICKFLIAKLLQNYDFQIAITLYRVIYLLNFLQ